ncbi:ABC transporter ATP-binding protein [Lactobacillus johnsonii]|uniref:Putative ABC transporter ATP-binding protein LJ_1704 n=1 Tax=Lactobacillus johnsonii (strain CNCM I-12250 / La1 / NCC 533) TaxID=257314 RepID=Y1704_LACJO|nr:ABC transporter ATP-binding protein [Lactobacillus johnsonii]Q74I62.1 RecName: Full=Putative ABC transporter ATP-binding protein LJ_1704 [Lactobacillus johnsonii NCC 533]AAS09477.1 ABC transporter ATPase component [Lactobacillus johnsonii NCC 533]MCT3322561.1 ATP-binding cassette domain-containing protein [Lactobacillus johnsonii]MCT3339889.1 ATP-binding cassette domain-containing protein [Lactobacillus johnsonii]MCT3388783.1 ATP-binding cassette domain-containing protein [Lactobacillus joh
MTEPIIEFKDFSFKYNSQAEPTLKNINLKINKGEKILLAGPSGSGKSTIGRCLNGLIPNIDQGEVKGKCLVNGKDITSTSLFDFSFTTSTILQDADSQFIGLTVGEDIAFALENDCQPKDKMHQTVNQWANELKIKELLTQSPQSLSGGQKQIVALAGVLVDESPILLFDEPLANLDPASGLKTMAIIDKIQKELNATVIIIEHRVEEVLSQLIDRIILVNEGTIVADQPTNQLLHSNTLEKIGVREPLYLKALTAADVNLSSIKEVDQISTLPVSEKISDKLAAWTKQAKITKKEVDNLPLLKLDHVGHQYSKNQPYPLKDVSTTINQGDFISIVGQNGAGKTTLCRTICGFISNEGKITLKDQNLSDLSIKERAEKIGYVMQDPNQMISQKMIFDEIALGLRLRNVDEETIKQKVDQTLKICGLYPFRHWPISALSFGQKKRVTIAAILVLEPEIIILDEPTAGQDWKTYTEIMSFLKHLNTMGKTIIIITHDMHLMLEYTSRSLAFAKGKLIADTTPIELLTNQALIKEASLKRTSLYDLAKHYNLPDPNKFVQAYINFEQQNWKDEDYE